jgi:hypothetical protein
MKKLEARYYPPFARNRFVVIAHVFIPTEGHDLRPRIRPARPTSHPGSPASLLSTLRYLVRLTTPHTWERLTTLRSRYWSFASVQLSPDDRSADLAGLRDA